MVHGRFSCLSLYWYRCRFTLWYIQKSDNTGKGKDVEESIGMEQRCSIGKYHANHVVFNLPSSEGRVGLEGMRYLTARIRVKFRTDGEG